MDAIIYFFSSLAVFNIILSVLSFALGLTLGWLLWAKYKRMVTNAKLKLNRANGRIKELKTYIQQSEVR